MQSRNWERFGIDGDTLVARVARIKPFALGPALRAFYALYAERFAKPRRGDKTPSTTRTYTRSSASYPRRASSTSSRMGGT